MTKPTRLIRLEVGYTRNERDMRRVVTVSSDTKAINMLSAALSSLARQFNVTEPKSLRITKFIGSQVAA